MPRKRTNQPATKVVIVDDHPAVREALAFRVADMPDLELCGEAEDVVDALKLIDTQKPDLAIIDISLKTGDGLDLIKRIKAKNLPVRILVWSMHSEKLYAERALRAGAHGYITKEQATGKIVEAIRQVLSGRIYLSPAVTDALLNRVVGEGGTSLEQPQVDDLSDRELEVMRLIGKGSKTAEIAVQLHLSVKTIETYRNRIRHKLNLADGADLVHYAAQWVVENK